VGFGDIETGGLGWAFAKFGAIVSRITKNNE